LKLERIISFANAAVRLQFLAMERSLRATGCHLPISVIPYDEKRFPLPEHADWLEDEALFAHIQKVGAMPLTRKYLALTVPHSAYFDADIVHLRNPEQWLEPLPDGLFVVADTEWQKARWTFTEQTRTLYEAQTTLWLLDNFNSGFFAQAVPRIALQDVHALLDDPHHQNLIHGKVPSTGEQEGANLLVHNSRMEVRNLCLPPHRMESTMACDYPDGFASIFRKANAPAFVHYAGPGKNLEAPIAQLIFEHLTAAEAAQMRKEFEMRRQCGQHLGHWPMWVRLIRRLVPWLDPRFRVQWKDPIDAV